MYDADRLSHSGYEIFSGSPSWPVQVFDSSQVRTLGYVRTRQCLTLHFRGGGRSRSF